MLLFDAGRTVLVIPLAPIGWDCKCRAWVVSMHISKNNDLSSNIPIPDPRAGPESALKAILRGSCT